MLRGFIYFILLELILLVGGLMFFPQWMDENAPFFGASVHIFVPRQLARNCCTVRKGPVGQSR